MVKLNNTCESHWSGVVTANSISAVPSYGLGTISDSLQSSPGLPMLCSSKWTLKTKVAWAPSITDLSVIREVTYSDYWSFSKEVMSASSQTLNYHFLWPLMLLFSSDVSHPLTAKLIHILFWKMVMIQETHYLPICRVMCAELRIAWCHLAWASYLGLSTFLINFFPSWSSQLEVTSSSILST